MARSAREWGAQETPRRCSSTPGPGPEEVTCDRAEYSPSCTSGSRALAQPGAEIRPLPSGGLCVPSCSEPGFIYRVSLAGEGRCSCPDWRHRKQPCKHVYAALVWVAKQRQALVLAEQRRAA